MVNMVFLISAFQAFFPQVFASKRRECSMAGQLFLDRRTSTRPALYTSAFSIVFYGIARAGPDGSVLFCFDKREPFNLNMTMKTMKCWIKVLLTTGQSEAFSHDTETFSVQNVVVILCSCQDEDMGVKEEQEELTLF